MMNYITDMATFDKQLRKIVAENDVPAKVICEHVGVSPGTFSRWMRGKMGPAHDKVIRLAEYFKVSIDYFSDDEDMTMVKKPKEDFSKLSPELLELKEIIDNASDEDRQALLLLARAIKKARNGKE